MTDTNESLYVKMRGRVIGPFDADRLKQMAKMGQLSRTHMLSADGQNWQRATEFPELFLSSGGGGSLEPAVELESASAGQAEPVDLGQPGGQPPKATWHYSLFDQPHGPVTLAELGHLIAQKTIGPQDSVWQEGMDDWVPISHVPQLAVFLNQTAAAKQIHAQNPGMQAQQPQVQVQPVAAASKGSNTGLIVSGYICAGLSLPAGILCGICSAPFALAGLIIGIITMTKGSTGHGIAQILISLVFGFVGTILGFILGLALSAGI